MRFVRLIILCLVIGLSGLQLYAQYSPSDFDYFKVITINADLSASGTTPLEDFPVLLSVTDTDLVTTWPGHVKSTSGYDILFFDENGNQLDHELEYWPNYNGIYVGWVRIPSLDPTVTTQIYMYYGNESITSDPSVSATWNSDYEVVLHLSDENLNQSTGNSYAISNNGTLLHSDGYIGRSRGFDGYDDYLQVPVESINANGAFTISFWFNASNRKDRTLFDAGSSNSNEQYFFAYLDNTKPGFKYEDQDDEDFQMYAQGHISVSDWHYITFTGSYNESVENIYVNGNQITSLSLLAGQKPSSLQDIRFGASDDRSYNNDNDNFSGKMDEIRISTTSYSADWIATEYANQSQPESFVTVGDEQVNNAVDLITVTHTGSDVSCYGGSDGAATLEITGGVQPYIISWSNGQSGLSLTGVPAGAYTATITDNGGAGNTVTYDLTISQPDELVFTIDDVDPDDCDPGCTGVLYYSISGGVLPYTLSWETDPVTESGYHKNISYTGYEALQDYQLELTINWENTMETDFSDLRFKDSDGNDLSFWIEDFDPSVSAVVWVKVPVVVGNNSIVMRYGDPGVPGGSDLDATMNSNGLMAEYYYYGSASTGPDIDPSKLVAVCEDITTQSDNRPLDHDWDQDAVTLCGQTTGDYVLISWYGWLKKPDAATGDNFDFRCGSDDAFRMMLGDADRDSPTSEFWALRSYGQTTSYYTFSKSVVRFRYDFWENNGYARTTFEWNYPGGSGSYEIVPQEYFYYPSYSASPPDNIVFSDELESDEFVSTGLCAGTQVYTVTDANNCQTSLEYVIPHEGLIVSSEITPVSCFGENDGSIELTVECGYPPYIVSWSNGTTSLLNADLSAGDYSVSVTDQNGLGNTFTQSYTIESPEQLIFSITPVNTLTCSSSCNGSFDYSVSGGTKPYTLSWTPSSTPDFTIKREISFTAYESRTDYQVQITLPWYNTMQTDFSDIRFENSDGDNLPYWIESYQEGVEAVVWIKIDSFDVGSNAIYLSYGNPARTNASSLTNTMNSGGLRVKYYEGSGESPIIYESSLLSECIDNGTEEEDRPIDHYWRSGAVDLCDQTLSDNAIVVWEGWLKKPDDATGDTFSIRGGSDDGFRIMLDDATRDNPTLEYWEDRGYNTTAGTYTFSDDIVPITFDYYERYGGARVTFEWQYSGGSGSWEIVPQDYFYYYEISDNPPDNFAFGELQEMTHHHDGVCAGTHNYTVTDNNGCTAEATFIVYSDEQNPVIIVDDINGVLQSACSYTITDASRDAVVTDNFELASLVHDFDGGGSTLEGKTFPAGTTLVTWTATDSNGNTASSVQTISLQAPENPFSVTAEITHEQSPGSSDGAIDVSVSGRAFPLFTETEGGGTAPDSDALDLSSSGTLEAWIYPESIGKYAGIIQKGTNSSNESYSLQFFEYDLCLTICYGNDDYEYITWPGEVTLNQWHHVAGVWDSDSLYLYLDGQRVEEGLMNGHLPRISDGIVRIGHQYPWSGLTMDFNGMIRNARIWNVAHNESEISYYQYFSSENAAGLVAHWPLNEGEGTVLSDISGNNNDATLNEGSWSNQSYTFAWSDGPDTEDRENLSAGSYTVAVTDEFGCTVSETFLVETSAQYGPGGVTHDLAVWLRADKNLYSQSPADPASHDDPVQLWKGFSTSWFAEQSKPSQCPVYTTSDAWHLNYNGYLVFDGQDDELTLDRSSEGLEEQHTVFFVVKPLAPGPVMAMGNQAFISIGDAVSYQLSDGSVTASASNAVETGKWSLISVVKEGNSQGATHIFCFGKELQYTSTDCSALSTGDIVIGADIAANHLNGDIAEVIIYNTSLTAADRQKVESYLAVKYGITL